MSSDKRDGGTHLPKYEWVGELGSGRKGEIKLMRNRRTQELVAVKYIARKVQLPLMQLTELLLLKRLVQIVSIVQMCAEGVFVQAGDGLSVNTERELVNHRKLLHPNIIRSACMLA